MTKNDLISLLQQIPGNPIVQSVDGFGELSTEVEIDWSDELITISAEEMFNDEDGFGIGG